MVRKPMFTLASSSSCWFHLVRLYQIDQQQKNYPNIRWKTCRVPSFSVNCFIDRSIHSWNHGAGTIGLQWNGTSRFWTHVVSSAREWRETYSGNASSFVDTIVTSSSHRCPLMFSFACFDFSTSIKPQVLNAKRPQFTYNGKYSSICMIFTNDKRFFNIACSNTWFLFFLCCSNKATWSFFFFFTCSSPQKNNWEMPPPRKWRW